MKFKIIWKKNKRLIKDSFTIFILTLGGITFFILVILNNGMNIIFGIGIVILIIISILLFTYFWLKDPHYYCLTDDAIYLKYTKSQKIIHLKDIEIINNKFKVNFLGDTTTALITKDNKRFYIGTFFDKEVVKKILDKYYAYKQKSQNKHLI